MRNYLIYLLYPLFIISCSPSGNSGEKDVIDIEKGMADIKDIKVSEVFDRISYIPLETSDSVLIGRYPRIFVTFDHILVSSHKQPLFVFDKKTGKYLNTVGHRGDDPLGYTDDGFGNLYYWVDSQSNIIYFLSNDSRNLLKFHVDGTFIGKVSLPNESNLYSSNVYIYHDTIWVYNKCIADKKYPKLICFSGKTGELFGKEESKKGLLPSYGEITDTNYLYGNQIGYGGNMHRYIYGKDRIYMFTPDASSFWRINDHLYFKEAFVDTIYSVSGSQTIPHKYINFGNWAWPYEERYMKNCSENRLSVDYIYGNNNILFAHLTSGLYGMRDVRKEYIMVYFRKDGKTIISENNGLINDIDNSIDKFQIWGTTANNEFYSCLSVNNFLEYRDKQKIESSKGNLNSLQHVSPEDNPIIVFFQ